MLNKYGYENRSVNEEMQNTLVTESHSAKNPQKKEPKRRLNGLAMLAVCAVFSSTFGFAGGYLANQNHSTPETSLVQDLPAATDDMFLQTATNTASGNLTTEEIVQKVASTVVEITTETVVTNSRLQQGVSEGAGSGVIIKSDGYIITNHHVIEDASKITVTLKDGTKYQATLVGTDPQTDVAVIKVNATGLQAATIGDSSKLQVGEFALAIGNPLGSLGGTVTDGIISALSRDLTIDGETMTLLQTNAAINPGNSGGGLFNEAGQLIGVVNAKSSGSGIEGLGFAIPINTAMSVANDLMSQGYVSGRIDLGMTFVDINSTYTAMQYGVSRAGVYVTGVTSGSSAQKAGFQIGDCITGVNGVSVSSTTDLKTALKDSKIGDSITLNVIRGTRSGTLTLQLSEAGSAAA